MAHLITALILFPVVAALFVALARPQRARVIALGCTALTAIIALVLWRSFDATSLGLQMVERHLWIPAIGAEYLVGIDGLSLLLVLLTSLIFPFAFLAQRTGRGFCALMSVSYTHLTLPTKRIV